MRLDLSLDVVVNAAGGLVFALAGLWALYLGRGARRARLIGGSSVLFGATYVIQNLARDHDLVTSYAVSAIAFAAAALLALLAADIARGASPRARAFVVMMGIVSAIAIAAANVVAHTHPEVKLANGFRADIHGSVAQGAIAAIGPAVTVLVGACAARFRSLGPADDTGRRALAALAIGFGSFGVYFPTFMATSGVLVLPDPAASVAAAWLFGAMGIATLLAAIPFLGASVDRRLGARVFAFLFAAALAALAVNLARDTRGTDFGTFGIARTVGVAFLVVAIVRYDLLGVPLPRLAARRGTLGAAALASLLIVAQVAQNFLSAQYGLLMGGVVAGALVFAASPLQRALERGGAARPPAGAPDANERAFRDAVRLAYRDRRFERHEEVALAHLADRLGLSAQRATEIRHEVELGEPGRRE